jgi:hypothetical protein
MRKCCRTFKSIGNFCRRGVEMAIGCAGVWGTSAGEVLRLEEVQGRVELLHEKNAGGGVEMGAGCLGAWGSFARRKKVDEEVLR